MNNTKLKKYAFLRGHINQMQDELSELSHNLVDEFNADHIVQTDTPDGLFSLCERLVWRYSRTVEKSEEQLMKLRKMEQLSGKAKVVDTVNYIRLTEHDK